MTRLAKVFNARRIVQGAATVLTVTLALAVRVEHACSEPSKPNVSAYPAVLFAYSLSATKRRILSDTGPATGEISHRVWEPAFTTGICLISSSLQAC
jgi:hypothetical protein